MAQVMKVGNRVSGACSMPLLSRHFGIVLPSVQPLTQVAPPGGGQSEPFVAAQNMALTQPVERSPNALHVCHGTGRQGPHSVTNTRGCWQWEPQWGAAGESALLV